MQCSTLTVCHCFVKLVKTVLRFFVFFFFHQLPNRFDSIQVRSGY